MKAILVLLALALPASGATQRFHTITPIEVNAAPKGAGVAMSPPVARNTGAAPAPLASLSATEGSPITISATAASALAPTAPSAQNSAIAARVADIASEIGARTQRADADFAVRISQPSLIARLMRPVWGPRPIIEIRGRTQALDRFRPDALPAFREDRKTKTTGLKKIVLSRVSVAILRSLLARSYSPIPVTKASSALEVLPAPIAGKLIKFNLVVDERGISLMRIGVAYGPIDWVMAAHVLLSAYSKDVRFAGEIWRAGDGKVYISNNSGSYQPSTEHLAEIIAYFQELFPGATFAAAPWSPAAS